MATTQRNAFAEFHSKLLVQISEHISDDIGNLEKFKQKLRGHLLTPADLEKKSTIQVLHAMERRGCLLEGEYTHLKSVLKDDNENVIAIIEKFEKSMMSLKGDTGELDRIEETHAERMAELQNEKADNGCSLKTLKNAKKRRLENTEEKENKGAKRRDTKKAGPSSGSTIANVGNYWKMKAVSQPFRDTCNLVMKGVNDRIGNIRVFSNKEGKQKTVKKGTGFPVGSELIMSVYHLFEKVLDSTVWPRIANIIKERLDDPDKTKEQFESCLQGFLDVKFEDSVKARKERMAQLYLTKWRNLTGNGPCKTINALIQLFEEKKQKSLADEIRKFANPLPKLAEISFGSGSDHSSTFELDLNVPYYNKMHDVILIRLVGDKRTFPKSFAAKMSFASHMHVLGHLDNKPLQHFPCHVNAYDDKKILVQDLKESTQHFKNKPNSDHRKSHYDSILKRFSEGKLVFRSPSRSIARRISGCPGLVLELGEPKVQMMLQNGDPPELASLMEKEELAEGCYFGHGLNMRTVKELLNFKEMKRIQSDIFNR